MSETVERPSETIDFVVPRTDPVGEPGEAALHWEGYSVEVLDVILDP